jgi:hypothetical protein
MPDWRSPPGGNGRGETVDNPNYSPVLPAYRKNFDAAQSPLAARNMLGLKTITENINGLSVVQGNILYGSAADTIALLAKDTNATRYLSNTGSSNNPAWAQVNLTNGVTGTLPVANGGTGQTAVPFTVASGGTGQTTIPWPVANGCNGVASLPSFSVHRNGSAQSINTSSETVISWTTERWDTGSYFSGSTYTPLVAGTYIFACSAGFTGLTVGTLVYVGIRKNGSVYEYGSAGAVSTPGAGSATGTWLVQMNGSSDAVDFIVFHSEGSAQNLNGAATATHASGAWLAP